jgi:diguanylate cyclase (GGDEF)-like protein
VNLRNVTRTWFGAALFLAALQALVSTLVPRGYWLTFASDSIGAALVISVVAAFLYVANGASGRVRLFWILQASSWALLLANHSIWMWYDLVLHKDVPNLFMGDGLLFVSGVPALAGLLLQPHIATTKPKNHMGTVDFLLLLVWWVYLYLFFVIPWQYVVPNEAAYNSRYDLLSFTQDGVVLLVLAILAYRSTAAWRRFYIAFFLVEVLRNSGAFVLNRAIELNQYFSGSWFDLPYLLCVAMFTGVALAGQGLQATRQHAEDQLMSSWVARLGMIALLSLPVMAATQQFDTAAPAGVTRFRILVTMATILVMAYLVFVKQHRLGRELAHANHVLEEAALTDPLTGVRNRRFFNASIEGDVGQVLRAYADDHDHRTRDLIFYVIDADGFKQVNDKYGHDAGDRVLVEMARRISSAIRNSDILIRWGGEEFLIVSRYTDRADAETLASRVLSAVGDMPFVVEEKGETLRKTCSIGWAAFPWYQEDPQAVFYEEVRQMADRALGEAKLAGKNRAIGVFPVGAPTEVISEPELHVSRIPVQKLCTVGPA